SIFSSLSIIPLYLLLKMVSGREDYGLIGAAFFSVTPAVYTTVTAPGFELQDFAFPLIFFHIYFFIRAFKEDGQRSYAAAFLSGAFFFTALAAWHLTQFYYLIFVVYIGICYFLVQDLNMKPFYFIAAFSLLGGILLPPQRKAHFIISFPMLLSYSLVIISELRLQLRLRRLLLPVVFLISAIVTSYIAFIKVPEYQFVYGLIIDKLRYFGVRPVVPADLPWETLVMWVSPFTGPSLKTILLSLGSLFILGVVGLVENIYRLSKKALSFYETPLIYFASVFIPLYLLFIRLDGFLVWFLPFQVVALLKYRKKAIYCLILSGIVLNGILLFHQPRRTIGPDKNYLLGVISFIRHNTAEDDPILTSFPFGPTILTYTDRPILLHPKFEAMGITDKIKEFEHALYLDEEDFYAFCIRNRAKYFLYQIDMLLARGPEAIRFRTHNLKLSRKSAAYKFHFQPESLEHFETVFSNPHYRIYRVLDLNQRPVRLDGGYYRVYDERLVPPANFGISD
ncbi:MAG TPA: hypothetical protein EYP58_03600, partial [bacterium (Candidatus Stahlbacteria)]|nr:hypothetical protein [Candidatus Stahlbacteria bacterium]